MCSATSFPTSTASIRTLPGWNCSASRLPKRAGRKGNRGQPPQPHRRRQAGWNASEFRSPTSTSSSRATASTQQKSTGRTWKSRHHRRHPEKHEGLRPGDAWLQVPQHLHRFGDGGRLLPQTYRCQALFLSGKGRHGSPQTARRAAGRKLLQRRSMNTGSQAGTGQLAGTGNGRHRWNQRPESGEQIPVFVSRDRYTHELEYMRADKWKCPDTICNVQSQPGTESRLWSRASGENGKPAIQGRHEAQCLFAGQCGGAWLGFLPEAAVQFLQQGQQPAEQQVAGLKDGKGVEFNGHVQPGAQGKSRQGAAERRYPAAESRTQVAVNWGQDQRSHQAGQEPLKQGQDKPTAKQKEAGESAGQEPESGQTQEVQRNENVISTIKSKELWLHW